MIQRPFYYTTLGADPTNADVVYGGAEGFYKSTDAGKTFQSMRTPHGDNHDIWVNPTNGQIMVQANDGGANVSTDGGRTWSTQNNQPTGRVSTARKWTTSSRTTSTARSRTTARCIFAERQRSGAT